VESFTFLLFWLKERLLLFEKEGMEGKHKRKRQGRWRATGICNQTLLFASFYSNVIHNNPELQVGCK